MFIGMSLWQFIVIFIAGVSFGIAAGMVTLYKLTQAYKRHNK
jgi:hypothetical protein